MSTTIENTQPEQPVASSTQDETSQIEKEVPEAKAEDAGGEKPSSQEPQKSPNAQLKNGQRTNDNGILKTTPRRNLNPNVNHSKYNPSVLSESDDKKEIIKQVEFYFSDSNLPSDEYLWTQTDGTNNLPVKIEKICTFGRMKRFKYDIVIAALRESKFLEVTGPEGLEEVKRKFAYDPDTKRPASEARSIYAKGFGDEEPSSQFDIEAFFAPYGPINCVRLRRTNEKLFKGSVFVEFQDEETSEKFLKLEPKPKWKGEHTLDIKSKKEYNEGKIVDIKDGKVQPGPTFMPRQGRGRGRGDRVGHRDRRDFDGRRGGDRDPNDWRKRREEDRANGFRDDRNGRDKRGGRGRGRGRQDRGPRNDRNHDHEDNEEKNGDHVEKNADSKSEAVSKSPQTENNKKRARGDDGEEGTAAKKVDSKSEVVAESS